MSKMQKKVYVITPLQGIYLIYKSEARGRGLINQIYHEAKGVIKHQSDLYALSALYLIYIPDLSKLQRDLQGYKSDI